MAFDNNPDTVARDETRDMISSEKVDGTAIYNREGEKLGSVHHFMVGKRSGKVDYVVMSFGGLFGMGEDYYPLPWDKLTYDTDKGGYAIRMAKEALTRDAPSYKRGAEPDWDRDFGRSVDTHYAGFAII